MVTELRNNPVRVPSKFMGCTLLRTISIHGVKPEEQVTRTNMFHELFSKCVFIILSQEELYRMSKKPLCGPPK